MGINAAVPGTGRPNTKPFLRHPFTTVLGANYNVQRIWNLLGGKFVQRALLTKGHEFHEILVGQGDKNDPFVDIKTSEGRVRVMYNQRNEEELPSELWFYDVA